ncbi:MAG: YdbL family protein [Pseudomonadota bacterium]
MRKILAITAIAAIASIAAAHAAPPIIEAAKAKCIVGEQADGYLGVIDPVAADEALKREVRSVNQLRKARFADLAAQNGITIEDAAAIAGKRLVESATSGQCVRMPDGSWAKQP